ncbi:cyclase family protein, partial [Streptococcus suis]|uniref:cyclase family protein n=1 Tax=Streptococcus suis TaxID=1307 RepID=UPI001EE6F578
LRAARKSDEMLEPYEGKLSRTVLREEGGSNTTNLLDYGPIAPESFVAFRSDWSKRWPSQDAIRNLDEDGVQRTPGWSHEALEYLIEERQVKAVGHETLDTDSGVSAAKHGGSLPEEYYLLSKDIYQLEVLANLDQVPPTGALISIAFPHWEKASGSPVRAIAILP